MILFFHFICILARYIVNNICKSLNKDKFLCEDEIQTISTTSLSSDVLNKKSGHVRFPVYEGGTLKFFPPVYIQRYETVGIVLEEASRKSKIKKVVDFGCSELGFFMYLKNIEGVEEILEVDIDVETLERYANKAAPLTSDYLMGKWRKPLDVYILGGSIADFDDHLIGCDALVAIELIEHLTKEDFEKMPYNVFHRIKPKIAIFTTPNAEFNSLFPNFKELRHKDHKFEWTRREFYNWTQEILGLYPEYSVKFYGIGMGPEGTENLGCCTQMAVFTMSEDIEFFLSARDESEGINTYELIQHYKYPFYVDTRTVEERICHEIQFQAAHYSNMDAYFNFETNESEIPLSVLKQYVSKLCSDEKELMGILENNGMNFKMRDDAWFLVWTEAESSPSDITSRCDDWLNEEISDAFNDKDDLVHKDSMSWDVDQLSIENEKTLFDHYKDDNKKICNKMQLECTSMSKEKIKSAPQSLNQLPELVDSQNLSSSNNAEMKKFQFVKSRIPRIKNGRYDDYFGRQSRETIHKPFRKIFRSLSLDSCLENINCNPSSNTDGLLSHVERKYAKNYSGSSLLSSSLGRAGDSGYPVSPPDDNLTPEQVEELLTEMSRSTSASSEVDMADVVNHRVHHDVFVEEIPVENGDLANNNRDGEGNNVEGLMGQRLVNEAVAERDPNDNLFFPEAEFPQWLLVLGELALPPVYFPLRDDPAGDDSSSELNRSLDVDDIDIDFDF